MWYEHPPKPGEGPSQIQYTDKPGRGGGEHRSSFLVAFDKMPFVNGKKGERKGGKPGQMCGLSDVQPVRWAFETGGEI